MILVVQYVLLFGSDQPGFAAAVVVATAVVDVDVGCQSNELVC